MGGGVFESLEGEVHFAEEFSEGDEKWSVDGIGFGEDGIVDEGEAENDARVAVDRQTFEKFFVVSGDDARQFELRDFFLEMSKGLALEIDEGVFAIGVHDFEDESGSGAGYVEVVVIFAGKRLDTIGGAVEIVENAQGFCGNCSRGRKVGTNEGAIKSGGCEGVVVKSADGDGPPDPATR